MVILAISLIGISYAQSVVVVGTVYESDGTTPVPYADVNIECNGIELPATMTIGDGTYAADLTRLCNVGDTVNVYAFKEGVGSGSNSGVVNNYVTIDVAFVDVIIPEFGLVIGAITALSSIVLFFVLRRK